MIVETIFEDIIYPKLKEYVETNSLYSPKVTKKQVQDSKIFPIVPVKLLPIENQYNNLNYGEQTYTFGIDINVYSQDQEIDEKIVAKKTICDEVTRKITEFFEKTYHVTIRIEYDLLNIDSTVHRNNVRISGKLDTKYGLEKLIIYPK